MISVTPPSRAIRMNPLGMKSRAARAPATSARPSGAGRLKLTSRPPPAAALALRKVRRDRVRTAVEINSAGGFPQQDHTRYGGVGPTLHPTGEEGDQFGACTRGPP